MTDRTHPDSGRATGAAHIIRYALELGLLWIDGDGRDKVREALDALDTLEAQLESIGAGGVSGPLMGIAAPPTAQAEGWISVEDARKPQPGKPVVFWVWAERYQEDDEGRQIAQDASGLHLGEWRESENGNYFDNYSTPFADREAVLWWMDPPPPTSVEGVEHG